MDRIDLFHLSIDCTCHSTRHLILPEILSYCALYPIIYIILAGILSHYVPSRHLISLRILSGPSYPTRRTLLHCAYHPTLHVIPPSILSHYAHLIPTKYLIPLCASYLTMHLILLCAPWTCHPTKHLLEMRISSPCASYHALHLIWHVIPPDILS